LKAERRRRAGPGVPLAVCPAEWLPTIDLLFLPLLDRILLDRVLTDREKSAF
jgi:hypothetical protein